jgi:excisionase family DNA binding protein
MTNALLTYTEAADLLKLTPRQISRLVGRGELPSVRLPNGEIRFDPDDIHQWVESLKRPAQGAGVQS